MANKTKTISADLLLQEIAAGAKGSMQVKDFFLICTAKWHWFIISVIVCVSMAVLYILKTPPVYTRSAYLMVKEDSKGKSIGSDVSSMFADIGLTKSNANVNNELLAMQMPATILEVVRRLDLNTDYLTNGTFHKTTLYGKDLPIKTKILQLADDETAGFTVNLLTGKRVRIDNFSRSGNDISGPAVTGQLGDTLTTPLGKMTVTATTYYSEKEEYPTIYVSRTGLHSCVDDCRSRLKAELSSEDATIIELSYQDVSVQRIEDVLNTVIVVYNEDWMKDKNQITVSTSQFINERLKMLEQELGDVDADISTYKSANLLTDADKASALDMEQAQENSNKILWLNTQISMAQYIRNYMTGNKNRNQLLPVNSGLENAGIEQQITEYNNEQLRRNNLATNSSEENPLIIDLDRSLAAMRNAIISSIDNLILSLSTQRNELSQKERHTTARIAANPDQTKYLQAVGRQQKVKEALYLFLLQKREENELSQAFTAYNTRILTPPMGNFVPIAPQSGKIIAMALLIAILIPTIIIYITESINTTIRGRKDLESLTIPFIGEIPQHTTGHRGMKCLTRKKNQNERYIIVKESKRDIINEAFRVLRTNLEFMTGNSTDITILTSFNPGSGKTFLTINIAMSLAIKHKRVLVIDGDMRHGSLSAFTEPSEHGLSDYLAKRAGTWKETVGKVTEGPNSIDIIPVGTIPPNPTELLFDGRLEQMLEEARQEYDYIFIDCPPIDIVADVQIFGRFADRTLFVIRAELLERSMLPELENLYQQKKFKNLAVILNGTENHAGRYGYRYGYHYGYGNKS